MSTYKLVACRTHHWKCYLAFATMVTNVANRNCLQINRTSSSFIGPYDGGFGQVGKSDMWHFLGEIRPNGSMKWIAYHKKNVAYVFNMEHKSRFWESSEVNLNDHEAFEELMVGIKKTTSTVATECLTVAAIERLDRIERNYFAMWGQGPDDLLLSL